MSFYGSNTPPAIKLPAEGGSIGGKIVRILPDKQATKFQTPQQRAAKLPRELDTWPPTEAQKAAGLPGDPKMQQPIILQLAPGTFAKIKPGDNGQRTLYVTKGDPRYKAIRAHYLETGVEPEEGGYIELTFVGTEAGQGANPKHIYKVTRLDAPADAGFYGSDDVEQEAAQAERELVTAGAPATVAKARPRSRAAGPPTGTSQM